MDRISSRSQAAERVDSRLCLVFTDDVVLLASSNNELKLSLGRVAAECQATGMRIGTSKFEGMVSARKGWIAQSRLGESRFPK